MTSFFATTFSFIPNRPDTVTATLVCSRQKLFSSIVPVILSTDNLWRALCDVGGNNMLYLTRRLKNNFLMLFSFSNSTTMQFTQKLRFFDEAVTNAFPSRNLLLSKLIDQSRYFNRTIQHIDVINRSVISLVCGKLVNLRSISMSQHVSTDLLDTDLKLICKLTLLQQLDLSDCRRITDDGIAHISKLKALEQLRMSRPGCLQDQVTTLPPFKEMKSLKKLDISDCYNLTDGSFDFSGNLNEHPLNSLSLRHCRGISDKTLENLHLLPNLFDVQIGLCKVTNAGIKRIGEVKYLRNLLVSNTGSRDSGQVLEELSSLSSLEFLRIEFCSFIDPKGLEALSKNITTLDTVHLEMLRTLDNDCLKQISKATSPIRVLHIKQCDGFNDQGFEYLSDLKYLETLAISHCTNRFFTGNIGEDRYLSSTMKVLSFKNLSLFNDAGLASCLKSLTKLEELTVSECSHLSSIGLDTALESVSSSLKKLDASGCASLLDIRFFSQLYDVEILDLSDCKNLSFDAMNPFDGEEDTFNHESYEWDEWKFDLEPPFTLSCLKSLNISYCNSLREEDYDFLVNKRILPPQVLTSLTVSHHFDLEYSFPFVNIEFFSAAYLPAYISAKNLLSFVADRPRLKRFEVPTRMIDEIKRSEEEFRHMAYLFFEQQ